jgi:hypothetical protein
MIAVEIIFLGIIFVLSIIGIGVWHTQRMAGLTGASRSPLPDVAEINSLRNEVKELRQIVHSLAINLENMKDNYVHVSALEDRIKVGE